MSHFLDLLKKHVDFHFSLALIAILGTAGSVCLQFKEANDEFDALNASMYSVVRSQGSDLRDDIFISHELDELAKSLDGLKF